MIEAQIDLYNNKQETTNNLFNIRLLFYYNFTLGEGGLWVSYTLGKVDNFLVILCQKAELEIKIEKGRN